MSEFLEHSISEIGEGIEKRRWAPEDVAGWCIAAHKALEPRIEAWEAFSEELLIRQAKQASERFNAGVTPRPLEAIPVGIKDIFNTVDFPTQMGSPIWRGFSAGNDARAVFNLRRAGCVVSGKTVTAEFAVHSLGKTKNPHSEKVTPGTSSSGSAAAVAAGMVPIALGSQTAGSVVRPASFCGVWGCKPSFGLVPRTGMLKTTDSLDTVGFFVSHASDLETVFNALRVHGRNFPFSDAALNDTSRQAPPHGRPWRIGLVRPHVWSHVPDYAESALEKWCGALARHYPSRFEIIEATLPDGLDRAHLVHETIYNRALAYYFQDEFRRADLMSPIMESLILAGKKIRNEIYEAALEDQIQMARKLDYFLVSYDALVTLSTAGQAPMREDEELPDSALMWTLTHLAVVSAPVFQSPTGLPFGLQIVARRYNDPLLFSLVRELVTLEVLPKKGFPTFVV